MRVDVVVVVLYHHPRETPNAASDNLMAAPDLMAATRCAFFAPSDAAFAKACEELQLSKEEILQVRSI